MSKVIRNRRRVLSKPFFLSNVNNIFEIDKMNNQHQSYIRAAFSPLWTLYHLLLDHRKRPSRNERLTEYSFALNAINKPNVRIVADIGTGEGSWPSLLSSCGFGVDSFDRKSNYWRLFSNHHQRVRSLDITKDALPSQFDAITCLSVIEHIGESKKAVENMYRSLKKDGLCILTFPYNVDEYHQNIYKNPQAGYGKNYRFHTSVYNSEIIDEWMNGLNFEVVSREVYQAFSGNLWTFGKRIFPLIRSSEDAPHHLMCLLLRKLD